MSTKFKIGDEVVIDYELQRLQAAEGEVVDIEFEDAHDTPTIGAPIYDIRITKGGLIRNFEHGARRWCIMGYHWWVDECQLSTRIILTPETDKAFQGILDEI